MDRNALADYIATSIRAAYPRRISLNTREVADVLTMCGRECAPEQARRLLDSGALVAGLRPTSGGWLVPIPALAAGLAEMMTPAQAPARVLDVNRPPLSSIDRRKRKPTRTLAFAITRADLSDPRPGCRLFVLKTSTSTSDDARPASHKAFIARVLADLTKLQTTQARARAIDDRAALRSIVGSNNAPRHPPSRII